MFIDHATIHIKAGDGGPGCVSFRREKYIPRGGPNGGDGGKGGDVIAVADPNVQTLMDFRHQHHWAAKNAEPGRGKEQHGADSEDLVIQVPPGTLVFDDATNEVLFDLKPNERVVLAKGGKGGFGNDHFKSSTNQSPRQSTPGEPGESRTIRLELKLIADVGLVGMPNAGKSTLLSVLTSATPKIADYPFTTLTPQLGIAEIDSQRRLVIADIPGLIEGAAQGAGLGHEFLRHIERTRVLVHLLDADPPVAPSPGPDGGGVTRKRDGGGLKGDSPSHLADYPPAASYRAIRKELAEYSKTLADKPEIIVLNKVDLIGGPEDAKVAADMLREALDLPRGTRIFTISAAARIGLDELLAECWRVVNKPAAEGWGG